MSESLKKVEVFDYRTQSIRELGEEELGYLAPELYIPVRLEESSTGIVYSYSFKIIRQGFNTGKKISKRFTNEDLVTAGSFKKLITALIAPDHLLFEELEIDSRLMIVGKDFYNKYKE